MDLLTFLDDIFDEIAYHFKKIYDYIVAAINQR